MFLFLRIRRPPGCTRFPYTTLFRSELAGAGLEGGDHFAHGFVEQGADELVEQARAELEIDVEVDQAAALGPVLEAPVVGHAAERTGGGPDLDARGALEGDARAEPFAENLEADHQVGE